MKLRPQSVGQVLAAPLAIALASMIGLVAALTGDGLRDMLSWIALGAPMAVIAWALTTRRF